MKAEDRNYLIEIVEQTVVQVNACSTPATKGKVILNAVDRIESQQFHSISDARIEELWAKHKGRFMVIFDHDDFVKFVKEQVTLPPDAQEVECTNCHEMVTMISTGEFCPKCMC